MAKVTAGMLIARALKKEGVEQIFTLTGGHVMAIYFACRELGIEVIDVRHECDACFAADAYARASGKAGVLVTTAGPGVTNTTTAMCEAKALGIPLVHIGGASPQFQDDTGPLQDFDTLSVMKACSIWARKITDPKRAGEYVAMAFREAYGPTPGPVYLEIARDVVDAVVDDEQCLEPVDYRTTAPSFPDPADAKKAAELLVNAKHPVMVVGDTARFQTAYGESVCELAEYLQIPVDTTTPARGLFADEEEHPLFMFENAHEAISEADVVMYLSARLDFRLGRGRAPFVNKDAKIIYCHPDRTKVGWNTRADIGIVADPGPVCKSILEEAKKLTAKRDHTEWVDRVNELGSQWKALYAKGWNDTESVPMNPGRLAKVVGDWVDKNARDWQIQLDGAEAYYWIEQCLKIHRPGQIIHHGCFGTMGSGTGFALGAAFASKKPILHFSGDGSYGFYVAEFTTFAKYNIPIVTIICNDSSWGFIRVTSEMKFPEEMKKGKITLELPYFQHYEEFPKEWGGLGFRVTKEEEIIPAIEAIVASGKPGVVNVEVNQKHVTPFAQAVGGGKPMF